MQLEADAVVTAPPALLSRVLDNLISNAAKYSEAGTPIRIVAAAASDEATIAVSDQGRGISSADQATVFEPFFRGKIARDAGIAGTGLGLAIAARIAAALQGRLECSSELGRGSTFTLRLQTIEAPGSARGSACTLDAASSGVALPPGGAGG
jgi:signal transduction histidine kinase